MSFPFGEVLFFDIDILAVPEVGDPPKSCIVKVQVCFFRDGTAKAWMDNPYTKQWELVRVHKHLSLRRMKVLLKAYIRLEQFTKR